MPWFPDFAGAVELVRRRDRERGMADPVRQYLAALDRGDARALEDVWPGTVVVHDPRAGEVRGHRELRQFVKRSQAVLAEHHVRTERLAATVAGDRAVVELTAHVGSDGEHATWPVAVVAEAAGDRSVVFRSYFCQRAVDDRPHVRPPILPSGPVELAGVVGDAQAALAAGDVEALVRTFAPGGCFREPFGPHGRHCGAAELRSFFRDSVGAGIQMDPCAVTDDGVRCAVEYICAGWGDARPQAALVVYERDAGGLLAAARAYDDIDRPSSAR